MLALGLARVSEVSNGFPTDARHACRAIFGKARLHPSSMAFMRSNRHARRTEKGMPAHDSHRSRHAGHAQANGSPNSIASLPTAGSWRHANRSRYPDAVVATLLRCRQNGMTVRRHRFNAVISRPMLSTPRNAPKWMRKENSSSSRRKGCRKEFGACAGNGEPRSSNAATRRPPRRVDAARRSWEPDMIRSESAFIRSLGSMDIKCNCSGQFVIRICQNGHKFQRLRIVVNPNPYRTDLGTEAVLAFLKESSKAT